VNALLLIVGLLPTPPLKFDSWQPTADIMEEDRESGPSQV